MKHNSSAITAFALLIICMGLYFVPSIRMESSENRTMATFEMVLNPQKDSVVYHESPVERLDAALSDQFPFREAVVKKYLEVFNVSENITSEAANTFVEQQENQYTLKTIGKYGLIEDSGYVTACPGTEKLDPVVLRRRIRQLKYLHRTYPDMKIYAYYVSQAYDMPWFNEYLGTAAADHYKEITEAVPEYVRTSHLVYRDLKDYMRIHYKTDHHWNHRGAKRGYEDIYAMMSDDFDPGEKLSPKKENKVSETYDFKYIGTYGKTLGDLYKGGYDEFSFYEYDIPKHKAAVLEPDTLKEIPVVQAGLYDEYRKGEIDRDEGTDHYIELYGTARDAAGNEYDDDTYPFLIKNSKGNGMNLLITGDSYDRAVRDLLASHFDNTVYVDYRILKDVPIDSVIEKYKIDVLLISSNKSMWDKEEFLFTFKGEK